jgi:hypothetical protein
MKVSFDFDGTLQEEEVQEYAKELISRGIEVWVVTTRYDENQMHRYAPRGTNIDDLWEVVDRLGIPRWRVRFTCMEWKWKYLKDTQFLWHLDDNYEEQSYARANSCKLPIILVQGNWKTKCEELLNEKA